MERQVTDREKVVANDTPGKGLLFKIKEKEAA